MNRLQRKALAAKPVSFAGLSVAEIPPAEPTLPLHPSIASTAEDKAHCLASSRLKTKLFRDMNGNGKPQALECKRVGMFGEIKAIVECPPKFEASAPRNA